MTAKIIKPKRGMVIGPFKLYKKTGKFTDNDTSFPEEKCIWKCENCGAFRIATVGSLNCTLNPTCQCCRLDGENVSPERKGNLRLHGVIYRGITPSLLVEDENNNFRYYSRDEWEEVPITP